MKACDSTVFPRTISRFATAVTVIRIPALPWVSKQPKAFQ